MASFIPVSKPHGSSRLRELRLIATSGLKTCFQVIIEGFCSPFLPVLTLMAATFLGRYA